MTKPVRLIRPLRERIIIAVINVLRKTDPTIKVTVYETAIKISWESPK